MVRDHLMAEDKHPSFSLPHEIMTEVAARRELSARPAPQEPGMEYQDAMRMLNTLQTNTQLEAMALYLARSGLQVEDLDRLNIIHVTGTKGKGSSCAFTERILRNYGLKTGFFSSPHLVQVRERICINGQPISHKLFTKHFWRLYQRLEETKDGSYVSMPAYFRFLTLMAFHVFLQEKVDLAVVEVGIGGAYDCTNITRKPVVCDHTSILGDTMEKIAWQKGGIFKRGVPAFTVLQPDGPLAVLRDRAQQISCPLYLCPASCRSCPWLPRSSPQPACAMGFGTRSGWVARRCCGGGPSPGTWTVRTPPAACRPACGGSSSRRCGNGRGRALALKCECCSSTPPGTGTQRPC
uniref:Uncharacterized protein n=1 Tax=Oryctolagus cuniculus TaxID=9986 RepID=U3KPP0_RABIT